MVNINYQPKKRTSKKVLKTRGLANRRWKKTQVEDIEPQPSTSSTENDLVQQPSTSSSTASQKKLSHFQDLGLKSTEGDFPTSVSLDINYLLVHTSVWQTLFKSMKCVECGVADLETKIIEKMGFAAKIVVTCGACDALCAETFTSPRVSSNSSSRPPFEVNKRMVDTFLELGKGHAGMEKFCESMGMHVMSKSSYNSHFINRVEENKLIRSQVLSMAHAAVRQEHRNINCDLGQDDILDVAVSYDGTWHRRGFQSLYGIGFVIEALTGLVLDYHIMSKYCGTCVDKSKTMNPSSHEYKQWLTQHKESGECGINFSGSSGAMEVAAAEVMWKRSVDLCKMRYVTILSDGDSKTFMNLQQKKVYGADIIIKKDECLNHIAKRLGTGLRNVIKEWKVKGVTIGGKKRGNLTDETVTKLTNYYRSAIKKNVPNVEHMKTAVYATLQHCMSTDQHPRHTKCPGGEMSWCFFNRAIARGDVPPKHDSSTMNTVLSESVVVKILPVYQRLAANELLERCTTGKTQNVNECLHSLVWKRFPKEIFGSLKKLDIAATSAVSVFNMGCVVTAKVKEGVTGLDISDSAKKLNEVRDKRRIQRSEFSAKATHRSARKRLRLTKISSEEQKKKEEGPTYGAGQF